MLALVTVKPPAAARDEARYGVKVAPECVSGAWISSLMTVAENRAARSARAARASAVCTVPVGLCGLHSSIARVPAANLLGSEGEGFKIAMQTLDGGRIGIGTQAVGIAQGSLDAAVAYAKEREQFGKKIGEFQAIQCALSRQRLPAITRPDS